MSCQRCGRRANGRFCRDCERDEKYGNAGADQSQPDRGDLLHECTECNTEYETDGSDDCPNCGSSRRRYVGDETKQAAGHREVYCPTHSDARIKARTRNDMVGCPVTTFRCFICNSELTPQANGPTKRVATDGGVDPSTSGTERDTQTVHRREVPIVGSPCPNCETGNVYKENDGTRACDGDCGGWWSEIEPAPNNWRTNVTENTDEGRDLDSDGCPPLSEFEGGDDDTLTISDHGNTLEIPKAVLRQKRESALEAKADAKKPDADRPFLKYHWNGYRQAIDELLENFNRSAGTDDIATDGGVDVNGGRQAFLAGDAHYCDICERQFQTLVELIKHNCEQTGAGTTNRGPDPVAYAEWEDSR